jgi:hypothetical protein
MEAVAGEERLFALVAGGFLDDGARGRLRAAAEAVGATVVPASIGHDDPATHFAEHVLPALVAARAAPADRP